MVVDIEVKAKRPELGDLSPQVFFGSIFLFGAITTIFMNLLLSFILGIVALIFGMLILTRTSQPIEKIIASSGILKAYRGEKILWSVSLDKLTSVDIDTYSEYNRMRGQTMIVFYLKNGDSYSIYYTNYSQSDLIKIKNIVAEANN